ncbi:hypothetical protein VTN31DRAFT_3958 [Thermomyces dupontii]|uniref:uncharacterized protein n=1 Tax=Talaromyces thermophilus TaxID=28565 RepID=UPI0037445434
MRLFGWYPRLLLDLFNCYGVGFAGFTPVEELPLTLLSRTARVFPFVLVRSVLGTSSRPGSRQYPACGSLKGYPWH